MVIIITKICVALLPNVNQIKGALQKVEKAVYLNQSSLHKNHNKNYCSQSVSFSPSISLNNIEMLLTPSLETKNEKRNKKRLQKTPTKKQAKGV